MRCWNVVLLLSLGTASFLSHQAKAKGQFMLQLERSDVTVWPALIGSAALTDNKDSWFEIGGRTRTDRVPRHDLQALSHCLLLWGDREGKKTSPLAARPAFCAAAF